MDGRDNESEDASSANEVNDHKDDDKKLEATKKSQKNKEVPEVRASTRARKGNAVREV